MKIERGKVISESLANFIKRNVEPAERMKAIEGTNITSYETVNRLLRCTQAVTANNKIVIDTLLKMAVQNSMKVESQEREARKSILAESDLTAEEFLSEIKAYEQE